MDNTIPYIFYCKDIVNALSYIDEKKTIKIYLTPEKCYMQGFYAKYAGLCEVILTPLFGDRKYEGEFTLKNTELFKKHHVCEISEGILLFDDEVSHPVELNEEPTTLITKKPVNSFLIKFTEEELIKIKKSKSITFSYDENAKDDELRIKTSEDFTFIPEIIFAEIEDETITSSFSAAMFTYIMKKLKKTSIVKIHLSSDYPLCIEYPNNPMVYYYLAPCEI